MFVLMMFMAREKQYRENYRTLLAAVKNRKAGVPDCAEKIIPEHTMRAAEKVFWAKRGFTEPPGATCAGVIY
jgi:hypothetical protein